MLPQKCQRIGPRRGCGSGASAPEGLPCFLDDCPRKRRQYDCRSGEGAVPAFRCCRRLWQAPPPALPSAGSATAHTHGASLGGTSPTAGEKPPTADGLAGVPLCLSSAPAPALLRVHSAIARPCEGQGHRVFPTSSPHYYLPSLSHCAPPSGHVASSRFSLLIISSKQLHWAAGRPVHREADCLFFLTVFSSGQGLWTVPRCGGGGNRRRLRGNRRRLGGNRRRLGGNRRRMHVSGSVKYYSIFVSHLDAPLARPEFPVHP